MQDDTFISVSNLSRQYGALHAVNNISFEVRRGEVLGFLGPNGAGKSTTMQMLAGNLAPSAGQILINGIDLLDKPKQAKAHIGYLPDQPPLYKELTVDEYLDYCARLNRIARDKQLTARESAKARCGLSDTGKRLIGNLSKGYQQRVGIAQAIIHSPDVVILDEPTVGLDPIQIREIRHLIRDLSSEHSVILSTHILPEVQATCDRVQIINKGELVLSDSVASLDKDMQSDSLVITLDRPPAVSELASLANITSVEQISEQRFRFHHATDHNPAMAIARLVADHDWGLLELTPERHNLEEIFVRITSSDHLSTDTTTETDSSDEKDTAA